MWGCLLILCLFIDLLVRFIFGVMVINIVVVLLVVVIVIVLRLLHCQVM